MAISLAYSGRSREPGSCRSVSKTRQGRPARLIPVLLVASALAAPHVAHARRHAWAAAFNVGGSRAQGTTTSKDFGFSGTYMPLSWLGLRAGYESVTSFEMTIFSLAAVVSVPLTTRIRVVGLAGGAHWTESPNGQPGARGLNPLVAAGLSYRVIHPLSLRLQYQYIAGRGALSQNLRSLLLSIRYRL